MQNAGLHKMAEKSAHLGCDLDIPIIPKLKTTGCKGRMTCSVELRSDKCARDIRKHAAGRQTNTQGTNKFAEAMVLEMIRVVEYVRVAWKKRATLAHSPEMQLLGLGCRRLLPLSRNLLWGSCQKREQRLMASHHARSNFAS